MKNTFQTVTQNIEKIYGDIVTTATGFYRPVVEEKTVEVVKEYSVKLWEKGDNSRYYITAINGGKRGDLQIGYYDNVSEKFVLDISGAEAERMQEAFLAILNPAPVVANTVAATPAAPTAETKLVRTYTTFPCAEESDDLSAIMVGVYKAADGSTFEKVVSYGSH